MPRRTGPISAPATFVDGPFPDGKIDRDAPAGVRETVEMVRRLRQELDEQGLSVSALARQASLDRTTIHDLLAGRAYVDVVTLARLERALGVPLWPGPLG